MARRAKRRLTVLGPPAQAVDTAMANVIATNRINARIIAGLQSPFAPLTVQ
jgi:hypothetical protein